MRFVVIALAAFVAAPALAGDQGGAAAGSTGEQTAAPAAATPAKEAKKICRRIDDTGSRVGGKKLCLTAEEWKRIEREEG